MRVSGEWAEAVRSWSVTLRAAGRSRKTIALREYQLERVAAGVAPAGPWEVTGEQLVTWAGGQDWAPETRRSFRSALRGFYQWAIVVGRARADPATALPRVKPTEPNPRPTPEDAYRLALSRADERTRLMVRIAAELGCRRAEVAQVHARDVERDLAGWTLVVHGKGNRVRRVPVTAGLAAAIRLRLPGEAYLFPGNDAGHLSPHYVGKLVSRALPEGWSMHSLRHRFGTVAYSHDRDLLTVQALLGHASSETTRRYVKVPSDALRRTVAAVAAVS